MVDAVKREVRVLIKDMQKYDEIDEEAAKCALSALEADGPWVALEKMREEFR